MADIFVVSGKIDVKGQDKAIQKLDDTAKKAEQTGKTLDDKISGGFDKVGNSATSFGSKLSSITTNIGTKLQTAGEKINSVGKSLAPVSATFAGIGTAAVAAFSSVNAGSVEVIKRTGAIGEKANELKAIYKDVAINVAGSFEEIGATVGAVSSRFQVTGDRLKDLSTDFQKFSTITGVDGAEAVSSVGRALSLFNLDASEATNVMDLLTTVSQNTGASMSTLIGAIDSSGSTFKQMGFSIEEAIGLMGEFESAGLNSSQMLMGLRKGAAAFAKNGMDVRTGLDDLIKRLKDTGTQAKAESEAWEIFGARMGGTFINAAKEGKISFDSLKGDLAEYSGAVNDSYNQTRTGVDKMKGAWKKLQEALEPIGNLIGDTIGPIMEDISRVLVNVGQKLNELPEPFKKVIVVVGILAAAAAPLLLVFSRIVKMVGSVFGGFGKLTGIIKDTADTMKKSGGAIKDGGASAKGGFLDLVGGALKAAAVGGSIALIGIGIKNLADAAVELAEAGTGAQIAMGLIALGVAGLLLVISKLGPELDVATPGVLALGAAITGIGVGVGVATWGISQLVFAIADLVRAFTEFGEKSGLFKEKADEINNAADGLNKGFGKTLDGIGGAIDGFGSALDGLGKSIEAVGFAALAWSMNEVANALERIEAAGDGGTDAINGIAGASDNAGGALSNLSGTGVNTALIIQGAFDGLSNAIYGVMQQIIGSITNGFNDGKNNAVSVCMDLLNVITSVLNSIADNAYWAGVHVGEGLANGMLSQMENVGNVANRLIEKTDNAIKKRAEISSPSKMTFEDGKFIAEGVEEGILENIYKPVNAAEKMINKLGVISPNVDNNYNYNVAQTYTPTSNSGVVELLSFWLPQLANMKMVMDTGKMVGELSPIIDKDLGSVYRNNGRLR